MRGEAAAAEGERMICEILGGGEGESNAISSDSGEGDWTTVPNR